VFLVAQLGLVIATGSTLGEHAVLLRGSGGWTPRPVARAIRVLPALESSLLATVEPILSPVWVYWATRERPTTWALAGALFIVGSVVLRAVLAQRQTA
jgi:hypothetical protein